MIVVVRRRPKPEARHRLPHGRNVVLPRMFDRGDVQFVVAGDLIEEESGILDRPRQGSAVVERKDAPDDAPHGHEPVGGLQTDDPAIRGRPAHRTSGVGPEGTRAKAGANRRARARGGPAGEVIEGPGISRHAEIGPIHPEFMKVGLPDDDRPTLFQPLGHRRVLRRDPPGQDRAAGGGSDTRRVDQILQPDGNSVERTPPMAGLELRVQLVGPGARGLGQDGDEGVQPRVVDADTRQTGVGQNSRGETSGPNPGGGLPQRKQRRIVRGRSGQAQAPDGRQKSSAGGELRKTAAGDFHRDATESGARTKGRIPRGSSCIPSARMLARSATEAKPGRCGNRLRRMRAPSIGANSSA